MSNIILVKVHALPLGVAVRIWWPLFLELDLRLVDGKLSILEEAIDEDKSLPADFRTAKLLKEIANTIIPMIKMNEDVPSNYQSGKLPILDLEVWVQGNRIYHQFFKKPMASPRFESLKIISGQYRHHITKFHDNKYFPQVFGPPV